MSPNPKPPPEGRRGCEQGVQGCRKGLQGCGSGAGPCSWVEAGPASHISDTLAGKHDFPAWLWPGHSWAELQVLAVFGMVRNFLRKAVPELKPAQNQVF